MPRPILLPVTLLLATLCAPTAWAQNDYGSLLPRLRAAVSAFEGGKPATAVVHLEQILKTRPSAATVLQLRDYLMSGAGSNQLVKMLGAGGDLGRLARYLLSRSEGTTFTPITSHEKIEQLVDRFVDGQPSAKYRAMLTIQARVGARAVPYFLRHLGEQQSVEGRTSAILGLQKLGPAVVIPLLRALETPDRIARQNTVLVLGNIGDPRAAGALRSLMDDAGQPASVRQVARQALVKLRGVGDNPGSRSASEFYLEQAKGYYLEDNAPLPDLGVDTLFWQWEKGKLIGQKIPPFLLNELLAEEACYGALRADPDNDKAWELLLLTYLSQYAEMSDLATAAQEKRAQVSAAEENVLQRLSRLLWRVNSLAAGCGAPALERALAMAMRDGKGRLAEEAARMLGQVARRGGAPPAALVSALDYPDRRVQFAAAVALARIDPPALEAGAKVVALLGRAVNEKDSRVALVISDNATLRAQLASGLAARGHLPVQAAGGRAGLDLARRYPQFDLFVLDGHLGDLASFEVYETLKRDARTRSTPILAVLSKVDPAERKQVYDNNVVLGSAGVGEAASRVTADVQGAYAARARARAAAAARALAAIHPRDPVFRARAATAGLARALTRVDAVRLPAARALARHGTAEALPALARLFTDGSASEAARVAAADAIGGICSRFPGNGDKVAAALQQGLTGGTPRIQQAAGAALGQAVVDPKAQLKRLQRSRLPATEKGQLK